MGIFNKDKVSEEMVFGEKFRHEYTNILLHIFSFLKMPLLMPSLRAT
jgi:hypothetical protein